MAEILVADDDPTILSLVRLVLEAQEHTLHIAQNGQEALDLFFKHQPDLALLDVMMPQINGIEVCAQIRQHNTLLPIIFLTASHQMSDLVSSFDSGADDYIRKPFKSLELQARVQAALRRSEQINQNNNTDQNETLTQGLLTLNLPHREAYYAGELLKLSQTEFQLLYLFAEHSGKILGREFLLEKIWSYHTESKSRTIDNFVVRLRRKLQAHQKSKEQGYPRIEAVYGRGYRFLI